MDLQISTDSVFSPEETASKVLGILRDTDRTEAVAAGDKKYGIITVRDLLGIEQPENTKIETIWRQVGTVSPDTSVLEAVNHLIKNNVTAIPVISKNEVALLSQNDISTALREVSEMGSIKAKDIMKTPVIAADKETPIAHARSIMLEKGISHIPILNAQKLVGIITGEDIVNTFITTSTKVTRGNRQGEKVARFPGQVSGVMEKNPLKVTPDASVHDVVKLLDKMEEKYCLVVDEEEILHGIITHRELLNIIYSLMPEPELPVYIVGLDNEDFVERSVVEEKIRRTVTRSMKMQEITEVSVKVKSQRSGGERTRYTITARALGPSTSFNVENEDWGLMETFDGLIDALDVTLRRAKKEPQKGARRGRRIPNPHLKP
ncbi:CBS domain-containing protein [Candidatus Bathyarchaeota archaeon]|nr:CBS domain-containing protein [Candidatus Bathyarchaeota archaeon]